MKAADGETDLDGVLFFPKDFDPTKKYPIIDSIYNGPFTTWVPRSFERGAMAEPYTQLGFLVIMVDGRGTPERGKVFQDVVYRAFGQNEIPDHAAALKQVAADRSYIDLSRVGITGGSWGGYMTVRAMVTHPMSTTWEWRSTQSPISTTMLPCRLNLTWAFLKTTLIFMTPAQASSSLIN